MAARETRRPLFVAEEIGIVPIRAILVDLDERGVESPATLVYGARDAGWLVYDDELRALARRRPAASRIIRSCATDEPGEPAEIASAVDRLVTDVGGLVAYVAGGEATINRVREVLMAKGLERRAVKWEKFW